MADLSRQVKRAQSAAAGHRPTANNAHDTQPGLPSRVDKNRPKTAVTKGLQKHYQGHQPQMNRYQTVIHNVKMHFETKKTVKLKDQTKRIINEFDQCYDELLQMLSDDFKRPKHEDTRRLAANENNYAKIEKQVAQLEKLLDEKDRELIRLRNSEKEATDRLSVEMSAKISRDESNLENVSMKTRPMTIADDFQTICSAEWHNAKENLDSMCADSKFEDDKLKCLLSVFMIAENEATGALKKTTTQMALMLSDPLEALMTSHASPPSLDSNKGGHGLKSNEKALVHAAMAEDNQKGIGCYLQGAHPALPGKVDVLIGDQLRLKADHVNVDYLVQKVTSGLVSRMPSIPINIPQNPAFQGFITATSKLAWKMALQRPPMTFATDNHPGIKFKFDDKRHDLYWTSADPKKVEIDSIYYVHPVLYHGEKVMVKGKVMLKKRS